MKRILIFVLIAVSALACQKEDSLSVVEIGQDVIYLPAEAGTKDILLDATSEWRLEYPTSATWMTTDLHGGKASRKYFTVSFLDNPYTSVRVCEIKIYTTDRNDSKKLKLIQMPKKFAVAFDTDHLTFRQGAGVYSAGFSSDVANADLQVTTDSDWITLYSLPEEGDIVEFYVDMLPSVVKKDRTGYIYMSHTDEHGRLAADTLRLRQIAAYPEKAELVTFAQARALIDKDGIIEDNYKIEGYVTADASSDNYGTSLYEPEVTGKRYIVESAEHEAIVLEASAEVDMHRGDRVELWLMDMEAVECSEGMFKYTVFSNLTDGHIITKEAGDFLPRKLSIGQLTYNDVFTLVELEDVEIAPLHGAFTNFKESSPSSNATSSTHVIYKDYAGQKVNWMKSFPEYYRFYPTPVIDAEGEVINMYVSPAASWAHESYPQGKGSLTGIVVRDCLSNFDIDETDLGIRPLCREDVAISADRENGLTATLVDFTFDCYRAGTVDQTYVMEEDGVQKFLPSIQQTTSAVPCTFSRVGAKKISRYYSGTETVGFQDKFRGDVGMHLTDGNNGRALGIVTQVPGNSTVTFLLENLCTKGITGALSFLVETNANKNNPYNPVRAKVSYSFDGEQWTDINDSEIKFLCQFDRDGNGEAGNREAAHIPGMKLHCISLPADLCDRETVHLKIEQVAAKSFTKTVRIGNLTIKYHK